MKQNPPPFGWFSNHSGWGINRSVTIDTLGTTLRSYMRELRIEGFDSFVEGSLSIEGAKSKVTWIEKDYSLSWTTGFFCFLNYLFDGWFLLVAADGGGGEPHTTTKNPQLLDISFKFWIIWSSFIQYSIPTTFWGWICCFSTSIKTHYKKTIEVEVSLQNIHKTTLVPQTTIF